MESCHVSDVHFQVYLPEGLEWRNKSGEEDWEDGERLGQRDWARETGAERLGQRDWSVWKAEQRHIVMSK